MEIFELNSDSVWGQVVGICKHDNECMGPIIACMGEERGAYRVLVGKPEGKRPLGRPRRRWVDNIRMDLQDVGMWTGLGWPRIGTGGGRL